MSKKQPTAFIGLDDSVVIEVVRTKNGSEPVKKEMTLGEWRRLEKQPGYEYSAFQKGYSQFNLHKK